MSRQESPPKTPPRSSTPQGTGTPQEAPSTSSGARRAVGKIRGSQILLQTIAAASIFGGIGYLSFLWHASHVLSTHPMTAAALALPTEKISSLPSPQLQAPPGAGEGDAGAKLALRGGAAVKFVPPDNPSSFSAAENAVVLKIRLAFETGDYAAALGHAEAHLTETAAAPGPLARWINLQMPALLTTAAWLELQMDACDDALPKMERAVGKKASAEIRRLALKGIAFCQLRLGNLVESEDILKQLLALSGNNDIDTRLLYAELLERDSRFAEAGAQLDALVSTAGAADAAVGAGLAAATSSGVGRDAETWRKRADALRRKGRLQEQLLTQETPHLRLSFRSEWSEFASAVANLLESSIDDMTATWGFSSPRDVIPVLLIPPGSFRALSPDTPQWADGISERGRITVPVSGSTREAASQLISVLRHELVHALFHQMAPTARLPTWFEEGVAQLVSCSTGGGACEFRFPHRQTRFLTIDDFDGPFIGFPTDKAAQAYSQSYYLAQVLRAARLGSGEALTSLIERVRDGGNRSSDDLLAPVGLTFQRLHAIVQRGWQGRVAPDSVSDRSEQL